MKRKPPAFVGNGLNSGKQDIVPWWHRLREYLYLNQPAAATLILCIILVTLVGISLTTPVHRWGDASTYYMQISSIAEDFDIQYLPEDIQRALENGFDDLPAGLFLTKTDDGRYYYSKEFSYALFAAPFYKILGNQGILVFNAVLFWLMILMGYIYLKKKNASMPALITSTAFFSVSAAFVYLFWIHPEIYNMFLITTGLFIWLLYYENRDHRYLLCASLIFGIATVAKLPNLLVFIPLIFFELYNRRVKHICWMILLFSVPLLAFYGCFYLNTGYQSFYGGERLYYVNNYPFLGEYDSITEAGRPGFSTGEGGRISKMLGEVPAYISMDALKILPYNLFYYFFGRFTGMIWYYPFALFALFSMVPVFKGFLIEIRGNQQIFDHIKNYQDRYILLLGICLYISAFLVLHGNNYFGGGHAVGNRYFYIYPAFLFLIGTIDLKKLIPFLLVAMVAVGPVISDPIQSSFSPETHTYEFPYQYAPIEYSQLNNLPFGSHLHSFDGLRAYRVDDRSTHHTNGFLVNGGTAEFLIRPRDDIGDIELFILPYQNISPISLSYPGRDETQIIDQSHGTFIALSDMTPVYTDNRYSVYRFSISSSGAVWIRPIQLIDDYPLYLMGWHGEEVWNGVPSRWMSQDAILHLYEDEPGSTILQFRAMSYHRERTLKVYHNDTMVREELIPQHFTEIRVPLSLHEGRNIIRLEVPDGCDKPSEVSSSTDDRCLSMAVQNITLTP